MLATYDNLYQYNIHPSSQNRRLDICRRYLIGEDKTLVDWTLVFLDLTGGSATSNKELVIFSEIDHAGGYNALHVFVVK